MFNTLKSYIKKPSTWVILAIGGVLTLSFGFIANALSPAANLVKKVAPGS